MTSGTPAQVGAETALTQILFDIINKATGAILDGPYKSAAGAGEMLKAVWPIHGAVVIRPKNWRPGYYPDYARRHFGASR